MLISATVTKKIVSLASITLKEKHQYISIHDFDQMEGADQTEGADDEAAQRIKQITPVKLLHYYMELKIEDKMDTLFSFLKSHPKSKIIVFFSARKQVRFAYQAFKSLKAS
jgi:ATP-dependent RNA helicase DDX10/DBP4